MTSLRAGLPSSEAGRHAVLAAVATAIAVVVLYGLIPVGDGVGVVMLFGVLVVTGAVVTKVGDAVLGRILLTAFAVRAAGAVVTNYFWPLPESGVDAVVFEGDAWAFAQEGPLGVLEAIFTNILQGPELYSAFIGFFYSLVGVRSFIVGNALNVLFGVLVVYNAWRVADRVWGRHAAVKVGWITALYPTLVLWSSITLREAPIHWLISLAALHLVEWRATRHTWRILAAFAAVSVATLLHGGLIVLMVGVVAMVAGAQLQRVRDPLVVLRERFAALVRVVLLVGLVVLIFFVGLETNKLWTRGEFRDVESVAARQRYAARADSAYLKGLHPETLSDLVWQAPIRAVYHVTTPFVWQVRKLSHSLGLVDALLHASLLITLFRYRRVVWRAWEGRALLITYVSLVFMFGLAASNFGNGTRHRTKFVVLLIIMAGAAWSKEAILSRRRPKAKSRPAMFPSTAESTRRGEAQPVRSS